MNIVVNEDLKAYIDPLTPDEYEALERSILSEGCRDALVLWGNTLVDGHNRHAICQKHKVSFNTVQSTQFNSLEDVHLWMIDQHLGRRSVSDFQRGVLALRKRAIVAERKSQADVAASQHQTPNTLHTREDIAKAARLSSSQVLLIEKIQKQAGPELVAAVKSGTISINAAAAVASLPEDEQRSAALAGKEQLKLAAKRVRDAKRQARSNAHITPTSASDEDTSETAPVPAPAQAPGAASATDVSPAQLSALRQQVTLLQAENAQLRQQVLDLQSQLSAGTSAPF
jgi:hypothetical protein